MFILRNYRILTGGTANVKGMVDRICPPALRKCPRPGVADVFVPDRHLPTPPLQEQIQVLGCHHTPLYLVLLALHSGIMSLDHRTIINANKAQYDAGLCYIFVTIQAS